MNLPTPAESIDKKAWNGRESRPMRGSCTNIYARSAPEGKQEQTTSRAKENTKWAGPLGPTNVPSTVHCKKFKT